MKLIVKLLLINVLVAGSALAFETSDGVKTKKADQNMETIEVLGSKPMELMRKELIQARLDFYDMYNALATRDEFQFKCFKRGETGTRFKKNVCERKFVWQARKDIDKEYIWLSTYGGFGMRAANDFTIAKAVKEKVVEAEQDLKEKLLQNSILLSQFRKLLELEDNYQQSHVERWGDSSQYADDVEN